MSWLTTKLIVLNNRKHHHQFQLNALVFYTESHFQLMLENNHMHTSMTSFSCASDIGIPFRYSSSITHNGLRLDEVIDLPEAHGT